MRDGPDERDPDETLLEAFWAVGRRLRHSSSESLVQWGVTPGQARALRVLGRHGTMRLSDLSAHLHIAPRSVTEVADDLEGRGLVRRRPDPDDRRAILIELTTEGTATSEAIHTAHATDAERVFDRLTPQQRDELALILNQLRD